MSANKLFYVFRKIFSKIFFSKILCLRMSYFLVTFSCVHLMKFCKLGRSCLEPELYTRHINSEQLSLTNCILLTYVLHLWWWHTVKKLAQETCTSFLHQIFVQVHASSCTRNSIHSVDLSM